MKEEKHNHAADLRKGRYSEQFGLYLITKCLVSPCTFTAQQQTEVVSALLHFRDKGDLLLHAFVVMSDHWHALISLQTGKGLGKLVECIGRHANFGAHLGANRIMWTHSFHDHKIRPGESVVDIVRYIENNPVRKGLAAEPSAWIWSSANQDRKDKLDRALLGHERWEQ